MSRKSARRVRRGQAEWKGIVRRFESSGLGSHRFCQREGLALSSLQRWRQRLGSGGTAGFVELVPSGAPKADAGSWWIELVLPGGACLRLRG